MADKQEIINANALVSQIVGEDEPELNWDEAIVHLARIKGYYQEIPPMSGRYGLIIIGVLEQRVEKCERTKYLYDDIMGTE